MAVLVKRVYDPPSPRDGYRVLVDRLWPRGLSKEAVKADFWPREIAPSDGLRKWFHERRTQWQAFREKYLAELAEPERMVALEQLHELAKTRKAVTLLFASKDLEHNNAVVLKELLEGKRKPPRSTGGAASATSRVAKSKAR
jgi:uncharacterized protein YeaO (DUF488 family)